MWQSALMHMNFGHEIVFYPEKLQNYLGVCSHTHVWGIVCHAHFGGIVCHALAWGIVCHVNADALFTVHISEAFCAKYHYGTGIRRLLLTGYYANTLGICAGIIWDDHLISTPWEKNKYRKHLRTNTTMELSENVRRLRNNCQEHFLWLKILYCQLIMTANCEQSRTGAPLMTSLHTLLIFR